jgi:uncharacterized protein YPO0396
MFAVIRPQVLTVLMLLPLVGCSSTSGNQKGEATVGRMENLHDGVSTLQTQLTATSSSLQDVCDKAKEDPRPAFAAFDKNLSATEASYKRIESAIADARASADAYFADWEKQNATMTDASMKEAAQERRAKLTKALDPVVESMNEVRDELTPLLARFKDARTYLSNDLTPAGIKSITDTCKKLGSDAEDANDALKKVLSASQEAAEAFRVAKPPPPQPPAKT